MSADLVPAESLALIERGRTMAAQIGTVIDVAPLDTLEAESKARELLRVIETLDAQIDGERKRVKAPHLENGRIVDDAFKAPLDALRRVGGRIRTRVSEATLRREREREAALALAAAASRVGDAEAANAAIVVASDVISPVAAGVVDVFSWDISAIDIRFVPPEYLCVDMPKIRAEIAAAKRDGRTPAIPGITFKRTADQRVRRL